MLFGEESKFSRADCCFFDSPRVDAAAGTRYNQTKGHFRYFSEYHESVGKRMQAKTIEDLVFIINQGVVVYFPDRKVYEETRVCF